MRIVCDTVGWYTNGTTDFKGMNYAVTFIGLHELCTAKNLYKDIERARVAIQRMMSHPESHLFWSPSTI